MFQSKFSGWVPSNCLFLSGSIQHWLSSVNALLLLSARRMTIISDSTKDNRFESLRNNPTDKRITTIRLTRHITSTEILELKNTESLIEEFWYSLCRFTLVFIDESSVIFKDFSQSPQEIFEIFLNFVSERFLILIIFVSIQAFFHKLNLRKWHS